ncbi:hypothetical protein [Ciceribacter sp. RN22]|uniref:hypothetical protein n=1 Tax=Ciceribacter sp. RN22 TaxID=2954932 RepID=UPI002093074F|nr:hypothetical protein [Ciceribacter sp. RN22]MCO6178020.1 hypothetical protein [Ciceribacter sp. RN22]
MKHIARIAVCAAALAVAFTMPSAGGFGFVDQALAGNGNGGGHGNGHASDKSRNGNAYGKLGTKPAKAKKTDTETVGADELGPLNAAHASPVARMFASPNSAVGKVATYQEARAAALELADPAAQTAAIDAAVDELEAGFGLTLTSAQIDKLNAILDSR